MCRESTTMNRIELNLDSTVLGTSGCILNLKRSVLGEIVDGKATGGYREKLNGASMVYGIAVHKFVDTMYKTGGHYPTARAEAEKAFLIPKLESRKSAWLSDPKHLITTCFNLWTNYIEVEGSFDLLLLGEKPATEITFSIPFYEDDVIKVNLCGTIDKVGKFKNGCYAIGDWKTTSQYDTDNYFTQYEMSRQLRIYTLACKLMAEREPESTLGRIGSTNMGAFIDAVFLKVKPNDTTVKRSDVFTYSDADVAAFRRTLEQKCMDISRAIQSDYFPKEGILNGSCEGKWGKCKFWNVCSHNDQVAEVLLKRDFIQWNFSPLNYNEV